MNEIETNKMAHEAPDYFSLEQALLCITEAERQLRQAEEHAQVFGATTRLSKLYRDKALVLYELLIVLRHLKGELCDAVLGRRAP